MNYSYIIDVHSLCRICLSKSPKMFPISRAKQTIEERYSIKVDDNLKYPQQICSICYDGLKLMPNLNVIYDKSQTILDKYILLNTLVPCHNKELNIKSTDNNKKCEKARKTPVQTHNNLNLTKCNWRCRYCYKDFKNQTAFKEHLKYCPKALQLKCGICGKMFPTSSHKKHHVKTVHHDRDQYRKAECSICKESFRNSGAMRYHKMAKHSKNNYNCDECDKVFPLMSTLKQHKETHNKNVSLVICPICGKSFHYRGGLFYHMKVHNNERNYRCEICQRNFLNMTALKRHKRTHTGERPYKCTLCPKAFFSSGELKMHIKRHTGYKPHECKFCGKSYISAYNLKLHISSHYGNNSSCDFCNKKFLNVEVLKTHIEMKHKGMGIN